LELFVAWAHASGRDNLAACLKTETLLKRMIAEYQSNKNPSAKPDTVVFNTVLKAFANSGNVKKSQDLLEYMIDQYTSTKDACFRPDEYSFGILLHAYNQEYGKDEAKTIQAKKWIARQKTLLRGSR